MDHRSEGNFSGGLRDRSDVETLVREFVPEQILPIFHRTIVNRLGNVWYKEPGTRADVKSSREAEEKGALPPLRSPSLKI